MLVACALCVQRVRAHSGIRPTMSQFVGNCLRRPIDPSKFVSFAGLQPQQLKCENLEVLGAPISRVRAHAQLVVGGC